MTPARRRARPNAGDVFINVPFDEAYEPLYIALIAGLCGLGLTPRCVLEISPQYRRVDRIFTLLRTCAFSIHDLSRVELSPTRPRCPRFNMPFELGLAHALSTSQKHHWIMFESKPFRVQKSLSDLNGIDPYIHYGQPRGVLRALSNAFIRPGQQPTVTDLMKLYRDLAQRAVILKQVNMTRSLYDARGFSELVIGAVDIVSSTQVATS